MRLTRPVVLALLACVVTVGPAVTKTAPLSEPGVPGDGTMEFAVYRKGDRIGTHRLTFQREGQRLKVHVDVSLKVKVLFMTVYRYRHESTEVWSGDHLVSFESETKQNGKQWEVAAHAAADDRLVVRTNDHRHVLPDTLFPTSYWNPQMMQQSVWFNTQYGSALDVDVAPEGADRVEAMGHMVEAQRYKVTGVIPETGKPVNLDLWYGDNGELVKLQFVAVADGSVIDYERLS
ncbi:MAG: hypothetical protein GC201_02560 [Alphaproteobacteria bacterium]|nr:hypothetical protein [Alphaproteobacteria bacterium]